MADVLILKRRNAECALRSQRQQRATRDPCGKLGSVRSCFVSQLLRRDVSCGLTLVVPTECAWLSSDTRRKACERQAVMEGFMQYYETTITLRKKGFLVGYERHVKARMASGEPLLRRTGAASRPASAGWQARWLRRLALLHSHE